MKRNHENSTRGFSQLSRAWYGTGLLKEEDFKDRIMIGIYHQDGGTSGEFEIKWEPLCGKWVPRLCVYDDAWSALMEFQDLLEELAKVDNESVSPEKVVEILEALGVTDMTMVQR